MSQNELEKLLDNAFQSLGWRDTTEAYYGLGFTPFMDVITSTISEKMESFVQEN